MTPFFSTRIIFQKVRRLRIALTLVVLFLCLGCATARTEIVPLGLELPSEKLQKEERERLELILQVQKDLEEKHVFYPDSELEGYLNEIARPFIQNLGLNPETDFTFKVMRDPTVNASSFSTGHIYFHSGILARLENEAQLAFVLAHEISHVYHRDDLYQLQNLKRKTVTFKMLDLLFTPAASFFGGGSLSEHTLGLIWGASVTGYGRQGETAADGFALKQLLKAGYDPRESIRFLDVLLAEKNRYQKGIEIFFLSSHPSNESRKGEARRWLKLHAHEMEANQPLRLETKTFVEKTYQVRRENAKLNADFDRFFHALEDIEKVLQQNPKDPIAHYYHGEIYRQMPGKRFKIQEELSPENWRKIKSVAEEKQDKRWRSLAIASYEKALDLSPSYAPPYKGLGLCYLDSKDFLKAREFLHEYLNRNPTAVDRRSVERYLSDLESLISKEGSR